MNNLFHKYLKPMTFAIALSFLLQFCTVYHKNSATIDQAVHTDIIGLKVITQDDRKFFFDSLFYREDLLLGRLHKSRKGQSTDVQINPDRIKEIHLYNRKLSRTLTIIVGVGIPAAIIAIGIATFEMDLSGINFD